MSIFNSLNELDINIVTPISDDYNEIIYMYLFLINYTNTIIKYITNNRLTYANENGILNDFNIIKKILEKANLSDYSQYLTNEINMSEKPLIGNLDDLLSDHNDKTLYFDTPYNLDNAYRIYYSLFDTNITTSASQNITVPVSYTHLTLPTKRIV